MAGTPTIASVCRSCSSQITVYLEDPYPNTENQARYLQKKLDSFVQTFNVNGSGLFSLDSLLRSEPVLLKRLLFLLRNTAENLARAVEAREVLASLPSVSAGQDVVDDGNSAATSGDSRDTFGTIRSNLTSALDPLESIDRNIRRLAIMSKYIDAAVPHFNLIRHITRNENQDEFESFVRNIIRYKFAELNPSGFLYERIIASLLLRRARFRYLRARHEMAEVAQERGPTAADAPAISNPSRTQAIGTEAKVLVSETLIRPIIPPAPILVPSITPSPTATIPSTIIPTRPTIRISSSIGVSLPKPPTLTAGSYHVNCPYCLRALPHSVIDDGYAWKRHLIADIQPLICLQENCDRALETFTDRHTWLEHMASHNQGWYCHAPSHSGRVFCFTTKEEFEQHMQTEHLSSSSAMQDTSNLASIISRNSHRPSPLIPDTCPICAVELGALEHRFEQSTPDFLTHVFNHLLDLALYSLPTDTDGDLLLSDDESASLRMSGSEAPSSLLSQDLDWFEGDKLGTDDLSPPAQHLSEETFDPLITEHRDGEERLDAPDDRRIRFEEGVNASIPRFATSQSAIDWWLRGLPTTESPGMNTEGDNGAGEKETRE